MKSIYLDNNATTSLDKQVLKAMLDDLSNGPLNPSSTHFFGREAKSKLILARSQVASYFHVKDSEVFFTSGGTESLNLILHGMDLKNGHIITSDVEHSAVDKTLKELKDVEITFLKARSFGAVTPEDVEKSIRPNTKLIILMAANNETGVKTDIPAISALAKSYNIPFALDAVAWIGKEPFIMYDGISALAISGHKFHGPKGIGVAILRKGIKCKPMITGGNQEYGKRGGTENLSGILGIAKAITMLEDIESTSSYLLRLRTQLENGLLDIDNVSINGTGPRIANTVNVAFHAVDAESLLIHLDLARIAVSHGSACSSGALEPSRVLLNMGYPKEIAKSSLRFSLSRDNTEEEINYTVEVIKNLVERLRQLH